MSDEFDPEAELLGEETKSAPAAAAEVAPDAEVVGEAAAEPSDAEKEAAEKAAAEEAARKKVEAEAALKKTYDEFIASVTAVVSDESVDASTGTVPEGILAGPRKAYLDMPAKGRKAALEYLTEKMQAELLGDDVPKARAYLAITKALKEAKAEPIVREPVDPTQAWVERVAAQRLAANLMTAPAGIGDDWVTKVQDLGKQVMESGDVQKYKEWLDTNEGKAEDERTAEPEVHAVVKMAAAIARGRGARVAGRKAAAPKGDKTPRVSTGDGTRRNIGEHIREAFADKPLGTFMTIAEICAVKSKEYEGTDGPSQGAVSSRLFPASGAPTKLTFVRPEGTEHGRPQKGAVKISE